MDVITPTTTPQPHGRVKSKQACEPCRRRKRKCDGGDPCATCCRYEYECFYEAYSRKRKLEEDTPGSDHKDTRTQTLHSSGRVSQTEVESSARQNVRRETEQASMRYMEANSGFAFPHILGTELDGSEELRLRNYAWNLGLRLEPTCFQSSVRQVVSQQELQRLAHIYFEKVHPLYGFIDRSMALSKIDDMLKPESDSDPYQAVLCGIAALGSLFSGVASSEQETSLAECAKYILEGTSMIKYPSLDHVAGWLLRTLYLRMAVGPHAAWIASCLTMHMVEATGAHQDATNLSVIYSNSIKAKKHEHNIADKTARLYWTARLLNTVTAHEYGRSTVNLRGVSVPLPLPGPNEVTPSLMSLHQISERFADTSDSKSPSDIFEIMHDLNDFATTNEVLLLHKANIAFCIYRRLRLVTPKVPSEMISIIITLGKTGLKAALSMAVARQPWWHVANVPFQFICVLLAIDTRESLSEVSEALEHLSSIASHFDTQKMRKALKTARSLISLCRARKIGDAHLLDNMAENNDEPNKRYPMDGTSQSRDDNEAQHFDQFSYTNALYGDTPTDLMFDPENFNWDDFLRIDY